MEYCGNDRLSELHDSLILNIFQLMPTLDVVKTTTLSKRWKNLWTTVPWLDFDDTTMKDKDKFRDFVNGALDSWRGAKILSFHVKFDSDLWKSVTHDDIDSWLLFATKNNVEDLKLHLPKPHNERSYLAPDCLYSCSSLKNVYLLGCDLQVDGNLVQWDQLRSLWIRCHRADAINLVLSGSPKLEYLFLFLRRSMSNENLSIRSSSLKHLLIVRASLMDLELRIWTPKLERLTIVGFPFSKCLMMNVSPLTEANLFLYDTIHFGGGMVPQILPALEHVERVHLNDWCIEALVAMKEKGMPSPFPNARLLELQYFFTHDYEQIVSVLGMFPRLRDLVLHTKLKSPRPEPEESWVKSDLFLMHLQTVNITWAKGDDSMFPLIEFLIKHARNLEKMVIWEEGANPHKLLLKMERSSPSDDHEFIFEPTKLYL